MTNSLHSGQLVSKKNKKIFSKRWIIAGGVLLLGIGIVYGFVLTTRVLERAFMPSVSATVDRKPILVGANGYGQINQIRVQEGQQVAQGEVIFTYLQTLQDDTVKEVEIKTLSSGTVTEVTYGVGSYVTPDTTVVKLQSRSVLVKAKVKVEPSDISRIKIGSPVIIELPSGKKIAGSVFSIKPTYDKKDKTIDIETSVNKLEEEVYNGTPVGIKVYVGDALAEQIKNTIISVPYYSLHEFFLADWYLLSE